MNSDTVAIAATCAPGEVKEAHPFHALFGLVATHGWNFVLVELSEVAHVRGDDAVATVLALISEGLPYGNVSSVDAAQVPGVPPPILTASPVRSGPTLS
jgi:hypothetical protein